MKSKVIAFSFFIMASFFAYAQDFVNPKDAVKMLANKGVVVIDCNPLDDYAKVHITNSVNIWHEDLYKKDGGIEGILKSGEELAKFFASKGVGNTSTILLYDAGSNKYSGRLYWVLKYLGAKDVKIINGGMGEWQKNRLPVTKAPGKLVAANFVFTPNAEILATMRQVKSLQGNPKAVLVDVRDLGEFKGTEGTSKRKGYIPGAVNFEYKNVQNANGVIKSKEELEKLFVAAGITPDKEIVLYCTTSVRAGVVFMVLKTILNYPNVKVYDGAYNEWEADASNPVK